MAATDQLHREEKPCQQGANGMDPALRGRWNLRTSTTFEGECHADHSCWAGSSQVRLSRSRQLAEYHIPGPLEAGHPVFAPLHQRIGRGHLDTLAKRYESAG